MEQQPLGLSAYIKTYAAYLGKWLALGGLIGILCGLVGALFYNGVALATTLRGEHPQLLFALPLLGLVIVFLYRRLGQEGSGTDTVIDAAREGTALRIELLPSIFIGTILTHLGGGSSGREGAALQIGGDIGNHIGRLLKLKKEEMQIATMAGMAAFFSAVFGTPLAAAMFVVLFISVGTFYEVALLPSYIAALVAIGVSELFGVQPFRFSVKVPEIVTHHFFRVLALAALTGLLSVVFCSALHGAEKLYKKYLKNPYLRVAVGGGLVVALTFLVGSTDYNGAGGEVIRRAVEEGSVFPAAFLLKILFTAITLEAGFKGGEIVPTFFIGATFGAFVGPLLGIPADFAAAVGLVAMFAGCTNTVIASIFLAVEVFGGVGTLYFALACIVSYAVSGYNGLYSSQRILYSKVRPAYINLRTNRSRPAVRRGDGAAEQAGKENDNESD